MKKILSEIKAMRMFEFMIFAILCVVFCSVFILPFASNVATESSKKVHENNLRILSNIVDIYYMSYGEYPKSINDLVKKGIIKSVPLIPKRLTNNDKIVLDGEYFNSNSLVNYSLTRDKENVYVGKTLKGKVILEAKYFLSDRNPPQPLPLGN